MGIFRISWGPQGGCAIPQDNLLAYMAFVCDPSGSKSGKIGKTLLNYRNKLACSVVSGSRKTKPQRRRRSGDGQKAAGPMEGEYVLSKCERKEVGDYSELGELYNCSR